MQTPAVKLHKGPEWAVHRMPANKRRIWTGKREGPGPLRDRGCWRRGGECVRGSSEGKEGPAQGALCLSTGTGPTLIQDIIECTCSTSSVYKNVSKMSKLALALTGVTWLGNILQTERSPVQFPIRTHIWVAGLVPSWGEYKSQPIDVFLLH